MAHIERIDVTVKESKEIRKYLQSIFDTPKTEEKLFHSWRVLETSVNYPLHIRGTMLLVAVTLAVYPDIPLETTIAPWMDVDETSIQVISDELAVLRKALPDHADAIGEAQYILAIADSKLPDMKPEPRVLAMMTLLYTLVRWALNTGFVCKSRFTDNPIFFIGCTAVHAAARKGLLNFGCK